MKHLLLMLTCIALTLMLTGCFGGGGGGSSSGGGAFDVSSLSGGDDGTGILGGGDNPISIPHQPEPATIALLGGGLAAYALLKSRKKK